MKGTIYTIITLTAFSSGSLMAMDFCTRGLPIDAAKELAQGKTDGKVATQPAGASGQRSVGG